MLFATFFSALALGSVAYAQSSNSTGNNTVITIMVGAEASSPGGIFQFIPANVTAANGTIINFQFTGVPGNHSVTQSTFANPCNPVNGGFDSGNTLILNPVSATPEWNLTITDASQPIWFFCKQLLPMPHCGAGMVGAINAPATGANTFDNFVQNAVKLGQDPTKVGQSDNGLVGIGASASANVGPIPLGATIFNSANPTGSAGTFSGAATPAATQTSPSGSGSSPSATPSGAATGNAVAKSVLGLFTAFVGFSLL